MKKLNIILIALFVVLLAGCDKEVDLTNTEIEEIIDVTDTSENLTDEEIVVELNSVVNGIIDGEFSFDETYEDYTLDDYQTLDSNSDSFTITHGGVYVLEGSYTSTITIDAGDEDVDLVLLDATISVTSGPAILVLSGDEITISAPENTVNVIEDSANHPLDGEEEYSAAVYSKSDLVFNGTGTITVNGYYNDGIKTKDDIKIVDVTLEISSIDDGIVGKDYIAIRDANISIDSLGDSLSSTNDEDTAKGFIYIESGTFDFTSDADGIQAENTVFIYGGTFNIDVSDDGIQASTAIYVGGGTIVITADGDAINTDGELTIYDGDLTVTAGDDALHGYDMVLIEGGTINILGSYEGIEGLVIIINGGTINIVASDDAINATVGGGQIHGPTYVALGGSITINGGIIQISSVGDGIDSNGDVIMTGGYLIVYGPVTDMESTIDYDGTFEISGGLVIAIGSDGMLQSLSEESTQNSLVYANGETFDVGTMVTLTDSEDNVVLEIQAIKDIEAVVISCEEMVNGESFTLTVGSETYDFTITSTITSLGAGAGTSDQIGKPPGR